MGKYLIMALLLVISGCYYHQPPQPFMNRIGGRTFDTGIVHDSHGNLYIRSGSYIERVE